MEAFEIAERIRKRIEEKYKNKMSVTISLGISIMSEKIMTIHQLIKIADRALYKSKSNGRNMTTI
jgi:diguanylate cyclase (GGDEF)-like protein